MTEPKRDNVTDETRAPSPAGADGGLGEALAKARAVLVAGARTNEERRLIGAALSEIDRAIASGSPTPATNAPLSPLAAPPQAHEIESLRRETERLRHLAARDNGLLTAVLEHSPHGVIICDPQGRLVLHNRAAERIWAGSATADNVEGWGKYRAFHDDGRPYEADDWSMARCLRSREVTHAEEVHFQRFDGTHGMLLGSCAPIFDDKGELTGAVSIFADITKFKQVEQLKDRWVALAGHEIRAPLTVLRGRVDLARGALVKSRPVDVATLLDHVERQVERLTTMVDDMLDVSRAQAGTLRVSRERFDLGALVVEAVEPLRAATTPYPSSHRDAIPPSHQAAHQIMTVPHSVEVVADRLRTEQVITNLVANAVRYSPNGGRIVVRVQAAGEVAVVEVQDEGIGFEPEAGARLFEPFLQLAPAGRAGGLGLGLYLARELVARMGGRIEATSPGPGRGATFRFALPRA